MGGDESRHPGDEVAKHTADAFAPSNAQIDVSGDDLRPLIVTARLDDATFARFDALRRAHFPPALNHLPAHLTLFHHLPGEALAEVVDACAAAARAGPFPLEVTGLRPLGRGVAYALAAPELAAAREAIGRRFADRVTPQDRQPFRPHVTVQNKTTPENARALLAELQAGFAPFAAICTGLLVWRYLGGPWALEAELPAP